MTSLLRLEVSKPWRSCRSSSSRSGSSRARRAATARPTTPAPTTVSPVSAKEAASRQRELALVFVPALGADHDVEAPGVDAVRPLPRHFEHEPFLVGRDLLRLHVARDRRGAAPVDPRIRGHGLDLDRRVAVVL